MHIIHSLNFKWTFMKAQCLRLFYNVLLCLYIVFGVTEHPLNAGTKY